MPNWCSNGLGVTGPKTELDDFIKAVVPAGTAGSEDIDLTLPCPMPEILRGTRSPSMSMEQTEEQIAKMIEDRDAGKLQAHDKHPGPLTPEGSWVTDEYLQEMRDQVKQADLAEAETGYREWYSWAVDNWGTKWPPSVALYEADGVSATFRFDSAWSPPSALIQRISEKFPNLTFVLEYSEPGMGFLGAEAFKGGEVISESYLGDTSADPVMESLNSKLDKLRDDPDFDGDTEEAIHDEIHDRWMHLQERCGADVLQAVSA